MQPDLSLLLAQEVERTLYDFSSIWEGIDAHEIDLGDAILKSQPGFAAAMRLRFDALDIDARLDSVIEQFESRTPHCLWIIGSSSLPADLEKRFVERGFAIAMEWKGLALDDISVEIPCNPDVRIEPLSWENAEEYAAQMADNNNPEHRSTLLASAYRFLRTPQHEAQILIASLEGKVAGYAVLRIESNGIAYLRNAKTEPALRRRGVYLSLLAHRLNIARMAGCTVAVVQALTTSSAPILINHGFTPVCRIIGMARKKVKS